MNGDWHENVPVTYNVKESDAYFVGVINGWSKEDVDRLMPVALVDDYWLSSGLFMQRYGLHNPDCIVFFSSITQYDSFLPSVISWKSAIDNIMWDAYITEFVAIPNSIYSQIYDDDDISGTIEACNQYIRDGMPGATVYTFSLP